MASITARDLGLALRDHLEGNQVHHYSGDGNQFGPSTDVHFVDVSEPSTPIVHLHNGQRFLVRISRS